jgi:ABC-type lipoprotein export system ATPase subunit
MNSTSDSYVLCARGLRKDHGRDASLVRAVDGVDLGVAAGETVAIMGPSGCGKSTLLYLLGGLERPTSGEIWLAGQNLTPMSERGLARLRRERIGFVFQAFHLMDELTAVENVELPAQLSGGQRQRVAIARALVADPELVLADEPTGNLDSAATAEVLRLFGQLHAAGQTLVIVTHDPQVAATADRMISMRDGAFTDQARPSDGITGRLGALAGVRG